MRLLYVTALTRQAPTTNHEKHRAAVYQAGVLFISVAFRRCRSSSKGSSMKNKKNLVSLFSPRCFRCALIFLVVCCAACLLSRQAQGQIQVLHSFNGTDGSVPQALLIFASDGNLYGTTTGGGQNGKGTVFKITPSGAFTSLTSFDGTNGSVPAAALIEASQGVFYGTTEIGGTNNLGTVFKITSAGTFTGLLSFTGPNGVTPETGALLLGKDGSFYGTATVGGQNNFGTVFKMTPDGALTNLWSFHGTDGEGPWGGLAQGPDGFYGTTIMGGANGNGTAFKITSTGTFTLLANFNGPSPNISRHTLTRGNDGNFYGTLSSPSVSDTSGTIFQMTPDGALKTLATFNVPNGINPVCSLTLGPDGNFYGTTQTGGAQNIGTIFMMTPNGYVTTLASFNGSTTGGQPVGGVVFDNAGNLYGTTVEGGLYNGGIVYVLTNVIPSAVAKPSVPTNLIATPTSCSQIDLSWTASTESASGSGIARYDIYQDGTLVKKTTGPAVTFSVTGLKEDTKYCFTISAYDGAGNGSAQSAPVCATTLTATPPTAPTTVTATPISGSQIDVSWGKSTVNPDCATLMGYDIYEQGNSAVIGTARANVNSYSVTGLNQCSKHCYVVSAYDNLNNESAQSGPGCATTLGVTPPTKPEHLLAVPNGLSEIGLTWNSSTDTGCGVKYYKVYRREYPFRNGRAILVWTYINHVPASQTPSYTDTGLPGGIEQCYTVSAVDNTGNESARSAEACAELPSPPTIGKYLGALSQGGYLLGPGGEAFGVRFVFGPNGISIVQPPGPTGPVQPLQSLSPATRDAIVATVLGGIANEINDPKTSRELKSLSARFARQGLKALQAETNGQAAASPNR